MFDYGTARAAIDAAIKSGDHVDLIAAVKLSVRERVNAYDLAVDWADKQNDDALERFPLNLHHSRRRRSSWCTPAV
jgi:hypothetical protein